MIFKVYIEERLLKEVYIEAEDDGEAIEKVEKMYRAGEIVLTADDFSGIYEIATEETGWSDNYIDPKERKNADKH